MYWILPYDAIYVFLVTVIYIHYFFLYEYYKADLQSILGLLFLALAAAAQGLVERMKPLPSLTDIKVD